MKKRIIISLIIILFLFSMFIICQKINKKKDNLEHIKVAEVTHSVFYAPLYVAIEKGYFQDYGLDIELILTPGADKVSAAVLSDDVAIYCF